MSELSETQLKMLCGRYHIYYGKKDTKEEIVRKIIGNLSLLPTDFIQSLKG